MTVQKFFFDFFSEKDPHLNAIEKSIGTCWVVWYVKSNNATYIDSFGVE